MFPPSSPSAEFPYTIEAKIGEGAMGEVYRATETSLGRPVAIKVLKPSFLEQLTPERAQESTQRFLQEARAAARLSHPGVTTIYRVGVEQGTPYIAMEWLDGDTLEDIIERAAPLPVHEVARIGVDLLDTLHAAHQEGVVHRDIKPGNVMVLRNGRVKVADFGVARMADSDLVQTQAGAVLGTPLYASPEQLRGDDIDARADVYSTGVVLYEMLTRALPYEAKTLIELIHKVLSADEPDTIDRIVPSIPHEIAQIVQVALSKRRELRFSSAAVMAKSLRPFIVADDEDPITTTSELASLASTLEAKNVPDDVLAPVELASGHSAIDHVVDVIKRWPATPLGQQAVRPLIDRLLERPLHAPAFSGAAHIGNAFFLLHDGLIYAVFSAEHQSVSDAVYEMLPDQAMATLHPVPEGSDPRLMVSLASLLHPSKGRRHEDLDSSFVDLVGLVRKLVQEKFSGAVVFERKRDSAYLLMESGELLMHLFSSEWPLNPVDHPWPMWVAKAGVRAHVEERRILLSEVSYRRELGDFALDVTPTGEMPLLAQKNLTGTRGSIEGSLGATLEIRPAARNAEQARGHSTLTNIYSSDPLYAFLHWMGKDLPKFFAERERINRWKYLVTWIPLIRNAILHHNLPRPKVNTHDFFDMVTFDESDKAMHIVHRVAHGSAEALDEFVERVKEAKQARTKTGDIGGACLIAPMFTEDAMARYDELTAREEKRSFFFSLQESMTGYEGFVRMGARRGFHLLLIVEDEGSFRPILPPSV